MDVLIVGAGAVGCVYGHHLALGGARVSVFVRPARREEAAAGYVLHHLGLSGRHTTSRFVPASVLTSVDEVRAARFDQVWIATDASALDEPWVPELLRAAGEATIVSLQPGLKSVERMRALVPETRLVHGLIGMISWRSPLEGSRDRRELERQGGHSYLFPPLAGSRFGGPKAAEIVGALGRGGCPAIHDVRTDRALAFGSAILIPHIVGLEAAGWSLAQLARGPEAALAARASRQALHAVSATLKLPLPASRFFVRAPVVRIAARLAPHLAPFDVETYLRVHFTKVRAQSVGLVASYAEAAARHGLAHDALDRLGQVLALPAP